MIDDIAVLHREILKSLDDKKHTRKKTKQVSREIILDEANSYIFLEYNIEEDIQRTANVSTNRINIDQLY